MAQPLPILEQITQNVIDTLNAVGTRTGYQWTLRVQRAGRLGNDPTDVRVVVEELDPTKAADQNVRMVEWTQPYALLVYCLESEDSTYPTRKKANVVRADIEKALMVDPHRGGLALDTVLNEPQWFDTSRTGGLDGIVVLCEVRYRVDLYDPYQQR